MQLPPRPSVMLPFGTQAQQQQQQQLPAYPFGPPPLQQQQQTPMPMPPPSLIQPQALGGMWQQMSPLLQADNVAVKYDGKIRTAQHQQYLMALADQILSSTDWNSLLSALNGYRMQGVRVLQQPVGPTAVQKTDVKFNGEEAMILSQLVQNGTYDRLKSTPILAMYEYFLTIDDYCMKCAELSEKCVRHLLAVRRQGNAPSTVTVETSEEGRLLPQRMSEEDIDQHKDQVPPPDYLFWAIRDLMPMHGKRRFDDSSDKDDKLTGLEGPMSSQFECGLTWVANMNEYRDTFSDTDKLLFAKVGPTSKIAPKTPYQKCVDEAILLSHPFYNDYIAICEGLFRIHFLVETRRLQAPDTQFWDVNWAIQCVRSMVPVPDMATVPVDPVAIGNLLSLNPADRAKIDAIIERLKFEFVNPIGDKAIKLGEWVNACMNVIPSGSPAGAGLLQPKPLPWSDYGDNYVRKVLEYWIGGSKLPMPHRKTLVQYLPQGGGAIGTFFAAYVAPTHEQITYADAANPKDRKITKVTVTRDAEAARQAHLKAAAYANSWGAALKSYFMSLPIVQAPQRLDGLTAAAPMPISMDTDDLKTHHLLKIAAQAVTDAKGIELGAFTYSTRCRARETSRSQLWERAAELKGHPIQHIGTFGRACAKVHFDNWLKRNYLFPLMRIFNEVCSDHADAELNCPPSTEPYPVVSKDGKLYAAPASQVGVLDPTTGRMTFPGASTDASRCVLPGATPPPPVPQFAQQVGIDRASVPQVKP